MPISDEQFKQLQDKLSQAQETIALQAQTIARLTSLLTDEDDGPAPAAAFGSLSQRG